MSGGEEEFDATPVLSSFCLHPKVRTRLAYWETEIDELLSERRRGSDMSKEGELDAASAT